MRSVSDNGLYCACKDCTKRYVGCHAECEEYKDFVTRNEKIKQQRKVDAIISSSNSNGWLYRRRRPK